MNQKEARHCRDVGLRRCVGGECAKSLKEISEHRIRMEGHVAEDIVKNVWLPGR